MNELMTLLASKTKIGKINGQPFALCPFHTGDVPTLMIMDNYYHCFKCGASGDASELTGVTFPIDEVEDRRKRRVLKVNSEAAALFSEFLTSREGWACMKYLTKTRQITPDSISKWNLGYAPNNWWSFRKMMNKKGISDKMMIEAGLLTEKDGKVYPFFRNRAIFPFRDLNDNVIGFGGRALSSDDPRKYINSRESCVYSKKGYLFFFNEAIKAMHRSKELILTEGNLDALSLMQAGFAATASCGTALTDDHARLIKNYVNEVLLCYDNDDAGQHASQGAIKTLTSHGLKVRVIKLTGAKDPDEFIKNFGSSAFRETLTNAVDGVEFMINARTKGIDTDSYRGKIEYYKKSISVLKEFPCDKKELYAEKISRVTDMPKDLILWEANN